MSSGYLGLHRTVEYLQVTCSLDVSHHLQGMQQTFLTQVAVTAVERIRHPLTMFFRSFTCPWYITVVVKPHYDRYRQSVRDIQAGEYADTHIQVTGSLLNRVEVGEERQVTKLYFLETDTCTDKSLGVADVAVMTVMVRPYLLDL